MSRSLFALSLSLVLTAPAFALSAPVALNENAHITESLVAAQVGDTLRKTCPTLSARYLVVLQKANALESYARKQGYTEAEVKTFLKNKDEKARIRGLAADYLAKAGAVEGDVDSYCAAGRSEIAKGTLPGQLLWSRE